MEYPRLTIITPSFNQGHFLEETILSVLNQNYPNLEYIIIDGGSTDNSVEIIKKYADKLAYWVSEKDRGQTHAINKGLEQATGEWVAYLNSDDLYTAGALEKITHLLRDPQVYWIAGECSIINNKGDFIREIKPFIPGNLFGWLIRPFFKADEKCPEIPQQSAFWRRELNTKLGSFNEEFHFCMDFELWVRFFSNGYRPVEVQDVLSCFRYHETSKTISQNTRFQNEDFKVISLYRAELSFVEKQRINYRLKNTYLLHELAKDKEKGIISLLKTDLLYLFHRPFWGNVKKKV